MPSENRTISGLIRGRASALTGGPRDYDHLVDRLAQARIVLIGEASHGTHEFYRERADITKRLIRERGFAAVAVVRARRPGPAGGCPAPSCRLRASRRRSR